MCLLLAIFVLLGPRALIFFWWVLEPVRWNATFQTVAVPLIGFLFLPWTTIAYVFAFPGGVEGFDWVWIVLGLIADIGSYTGSAWTNRDRGVYTDYDGV